MQDSPERMAEVRLMGWLTGQVHEDSGRDQAGAAARAGCPTEPPTAANTATASRTVTHKTARVDISNKLGVPPGCYQGK
jgi:hypothetical protein